MDAATITQEVLASIPAFDDALALRTYAHLTHTPEQRARSEREAFEAHILNVVTNALAIAESPAQQDELRKAVTWYASAYLTRLNDVLHARSKTASSFITGGANFPVKRNQKALQTESNRESMLQMFVKSGQIDIARRIAALETPEQKSAAIVKRMCKAVDKDLAIIAAIERGEQPGFESKAFVSSITRTVRGIYRNAFDTEGDAVLDHIERRRQELGIQALAKSSIWKLRAEPVAVR